MFVSNDRSQTQAEGDPKPQFYRDTVGKKHSTCFPFRFKNETIILPRQARDKHEIIVELNVFVCRLLRSLPHERHLQQQDGRLPRLDGTVHDQRDRDRYLCCCNIRPISVDPLCSRWWKRNIYNSTRSCSLSVWRECAGEYDAQQSVEAEDYFGADDASKQVDLRAEHADSNEDGFAVAVTHGSVLRYPNVRNLDADSGGQTRLLVRLSARSSRGGAELELRSGAPDGALLGKIEVPSRNASDSNSVVEDGAFETLECAVDSAKVAREVDERGGSGVADLHLVVVGDALLWLDSWRLAREAAAQ